MEISFWFYKRVKKWKLIMEIHFTSQTLFTIFGWPISNSMLATWVAIIVLAIIAVLATRKMALIPSGIQNFFEWIVESLLNLIDSVTQDRIKSEKFLPWIITFFLFIITTNWMELIPGFGSIGLETIQNGEVIFTPLLRSANTDINTTLALAIISLILIQITGIMAIGIFKYGKKFINFSSPINFFMGILEIISEISKIISFAFRLFGNIFAGEVLLVVIAFLIPYIAPLPFYALEIFVGFIQALVFSMLTLVFMTIATKTEEH